MNYTRNARLVWHTYSGHARHFSNYRICKFVRAEFSAEVAGRLPAFLYQLEDGFLDDFRNDDWYGGFCDYIDGCADLLSGESYTGSDSDYTYSPGHDADVDPGFSAPSLLRNLGIALVISCVIALIVCLILKAKMRSVRRQTEARAYVTPAGLHLTRRDDVYTHTTTTRRKIERDNDHHSGGGGSSFSGGGGHGRSGSF